MRLHRKRRVMLVTGASGFLGSHLVRGPGSGEWEIIAPSSTSMDITNRARVLDTITGWKPNVVVHLAYRKDRRAIVDGTRHVAEAAVEAKARLIHMSTDALFAGRPLPYTEQDTPDPVIDYGTHKRDAELLVAEIAPKAAIVRTSLLYGTERLSPFQVDLERSLRHGGSPMTFFTDEFRCPVHADDVAAAISTLAKQRDVSGLLHVAGPDRLSRLDYAVTCAQYLGTSMPAFPTATIAESGLTRPGDVTLDSSLAATLGIRCRSIAEALRP